MDRLAQLVFGRNPPDKVGAGTWGLLAACLALLAWKAWSIWRLNVNWDEFYFLTHVHALLRGDLQIAFQTVYTRLFGWLAWIGGSELPQIHAARLCMLALLVLALLQMIRLASRWVSPAAAVAAPLAFLCFQTTQRHGASFRADSLLLPLLLGAILLLTRTQYSRRTDLAAGVLCGMGMAVSVKMALFAPLLLACVLFAPVDAMAGAARWRSRSIRLVIIGGATFVTAAVLIGLHSLMLPAPPAESAVTFADRTINKVFLDDKVSPAMIYFRGILREDRFLWIAIGLGALVALWRRRWQAAAMVLALIPILFYRNSFPYFYIVMLGPPVVLIGFVVDEVRALARRGVSASRRDWVPLACAGLLLFHGTARLPLMSVQEQTGQRQVLDAVHAIFPTPVSYIDHSGMVSTFRKSNFFMSTWGMSAYQARSKPFVAPAIRDFRPPLLLVNRSFLDATHPSAQHNLLPEDRELLSKFYQPYWGPVLVAGARRELASGQSGSMDLPFPGSYRLQSQEPVSIDGVVRKPGDVVDVAGTRVQVARGVEKPGDALTVSLIWAAAQPAPREAPDYNYIYNGL